MFFGFSQDKSHFQVLNAQCENEQLQFQGEKKFGTYINLCSAAVLKTWVRDCASQNLLEDQSSDISKIQSSSQASPVPL